MEECEEFTVCRGFTDSDGSWLEPFVDNGRKPTLSIGNRPVYRSYRRHSANGPLIAGLGLICLLGALLVWWPGNRQRAERVSRATAQNMQPPARSSVRHVPPQAVNQMSVQPKRVDGPNEFEVPTQGASQSLVPRPIDRVAMKDGNIGGARTDTLRVESSIRADDLEDDFTDLADLEPFDPKKDEASSNDLRFPADQFDFEEDLTAIPDSPADPFAATEKTDDDLEPFGESNVFDNDVAIAAEPPQKIEPRLQEPAIPAEPQLPTEPDHLLIDQRISSAVVEIRQEMKRIAEQQVDEAVNTHRERIASLEKELAELRIAAVQADQNKNDDEDSALEQVFPGKKVQRPKTVELRTPEARIPVLPAPIPQSPETTRNGVNRSTPPPSYVYITPEPKFMPIVPVTATPLTINQAVQFAIPVSPSAASASPSPARCPKCTSSSPRRSLLSRLRSNRKSVCKHCGTVHRFK